MVISTIQLNCLRLLLGATFSTWVLCPQNPLCLCSPENLAIKKCFDSESADLICNWTPEQTTSTVVNDYFDETTRYEEENLMDEYYVDNPSNEQVGFFFLFDQFYSLPLSYFL